MSTGVLAMVSATAGEEMVSPAQQSNYLFPGLLAYWFVVCYPNRV